MSPRRARAIRVPGQSYVAIPKAWGLPCTVWTHSVYGAGVLFSSVCILPGTEHPEHAETRSQTPQIVAPGLPHAFPTVESCMQPGSVCCSVQRRLVIVGVCWWWQIAPSLFWLFGRSGLVFHCSGLIADGCACLTANLGRPPPFLPGDNSDGSDHDLIALHQKAGCSLCRSCLARRN